MKKTVTKLDRKEMKKNARSRMFHFYWICVFWCLFVAVLGIEYRSSLTVFTSDVASTKTDLTLNLLQSVLNQVDENEIAGEAAPNPPEEQKIGVVSIGYTSGVFASLYNSFSSGELMERVYSAILSITKSGNAADVLFVILGFTIVLGFLFFVTNIISVTYKRFFMEACIYDRIPLSKALYIYRTGKTINVAAGVIVKDLFLFLWSLTVVGVWIKTYSYMMVPYILAENPSIKPMDAIRLSKKMMHGHKWEAFLLNLSFLPWTFLDLFTAGLCGILYAHPYEEMTKAEYYRYIRALAKKNGLARTELLNDKYLFSFASVENLEKVYYADVAQNVREIQKMDPPKNTGVRGFFENVFGLTGFYDEKEMAYEQFANRYEATRHMQDVLALRAYPTRLFPIPLPERLKHVRSIHYDRHYSIGSIILIFMTLCGVGWLWECSYHMVATGDVVNRGALHGPWLPIYGCGGVLILLLLNKLRKHPFVEFFSAVALSGVLEYYTSVLMEYLHDGMRWWDYSGYFININGRICGEGLLLFGMGGIAIVYVVAPFLDNQFRRLSKKAMLILCITLITLFCADAVYSFFYPNGGSGITEASASQEQMIKTEISDYVTFPDLKENSLC